LFLIALLACGAGPQDNSPKDDVVDLTVSLAPPASGYQVVTEPFEVAPYEEIEMCTVIRAEPHGDERLGWFNRVEMSSSEGSHHMNVLVGALSFLDVFSGDGAAEAAMGVPQGMYPCADLNYMETLFPAFPSQRSQQEITFPDGVAAPLLVPALLVFSHHYVNASDETKRINTAINFHTIPAEEVVEVAGLIFDAVPDIEIPPQSEVVVNRTCVMDREVDFALVSSHNHEKTECASLNHYDDGLIDDTPFFVNRLWETPPLLHFYPGEFTVSPGQGVHYACHYRNETDETIIDDGTAAGEMCVFAGVIYPANLTVPEVTEIVEYGDIMGLTELMNVAMGSCDSYTEAGSPWVTEVRPLDDAPDGCEAYAQTVSNTLE
jgi:hypothetical protein